MDDDMSAGVMQMPDGSLYLSSAAKTGPDQTKNTVCMPALNYSILAHNIT